MADEIEKIDDKHIRVTTTITRIESEERLLNEEQELLQDRDDLDSRAEKLAAKLAALKNKVKK